ncbi:MAG: Crp/Fnr family transcriptional regulator [Deltaproteobacteria bacterium]|nr:Crp/Fnr family transcriptional regulator [Deltaproteobacteria bacterium]
MTSPPTSPQAAGLLKCLGGELDEGTAPLVGRAEVRSAPPGTILGRQGEFSPGVFLILDGLVRLYRAHESGRELVLWNLTDPDCFCFSPPCTDLASPFSAQCLAPTRYAHIPAPEWNRHVCERANRMTGLIECLSQERGDLGRWAEELSTLTVPQRLRSHLAFLAKVRGTAEAGAIRLTYGASRAQLAAAIGTAPEVVTRALSELVAKGIIERAGRHLRVLAPDRLGPPPAPPRTSLAVGPTRAAPATALPRPADPRPTRAR